jgi:hypothetical protein
LAIFKLCCWLFLNLHSLFIVANSPFIGHPGRAGKGLGTLLQPLELERQGSLDASLGEQSCFALFYLFSGGGLGRKMTVSVLPCYAAPFLVPCLQRDPFLRH